MKKLIRIVLTIQFALMLTHCAVSTDELYAAYSTCRAETLHVKTTDAGVVMVHSDGSPVMVYEEGACPDEFAKWDKSQALKEKRRRERELAAASVCPDGQTRWCNTRGPGDTRCGCVDNGDVREAFRKMGF